MPGSPRVEDPVFDQPVGTGGGSVANPSRVVSPATAPVVVNPGAGASLGTVGLLTLLVGAWAGIIPFVGPLFGFNATGTPAWTWSLEHALVWLVPGAVAVVFGMTMLALAPMARTGMSRIGPMWEGFIVACCGSWLVISPVAWRVLEGARSIRPAGTTTELVYWIGYDLGPGVLLAVLGGMAMGIAMLTRRERSVSRPVTVRGEQVAA